MRLLESLCAVMKNDTEKIPHATTKTLCGKNKQINIKKKKKEIEGML